MAIELEGKVEYDSNVGHILEAVAAWQHFL